MTAAASVRFLSDDYLAQMATLSTEDPHPIPGVDVVVEFHATDTPEGTVDFHLRVEDALVVGAGHGPAGDPDLEITATYADLVAFQAGELHAATAFVTGQFAVTGDKAKLLDLMIVLQSGTYHRFVATLWERTTW